MALYTVPNPPCPIRTAPAMPSIPRSPALGSFTRAPSRTAPPRAGTAAARLATTEDHYTSGSARAADTFPDVQIHAIEVSGILG
jgi:hypothetical protein